MFAKLTEFGKALRNFRMDKGLSLKDMAEAIDYSSSFVSAVELGKKNTPDDFVEKLRDAYNFSEEEFQKFKYLADVSAREIRMNLTTHSLKDRDLIVCFARSFEKLDASQREDLREKLTGRKM